MIPSPKTSLLLSLLLLLPFFAWTQLEEADAQLANGDCQAAATTYESLRTDNRSGPAARLGLAQLYSTTTCEQYDLEKAYDLLAELNSWHRSLDKKGKEQATRRGFNNGVFSRLRKKVIAELLTTALALNDPVVLDSFLLQRRALIRRSQESEIRDRRNNMLLALLSPSPSVADLQYLEREYGVSFRKDSDELLDTLHQLELNAWTKENGWASWKEMLATFLDNSFAKDRNRDDFLAIRTSANPRRFQQFNQQNPRSKWASIAQDSAQVSSSRTEQLRLDMDQAFLHLQDSSANSSWASADLNIRNWLAGGLIQQEATAQFLRELPGERAPKSQDFFRDYYLRRNGDLDGLLYLQRQFPLYYNREGLQVSIDSLQQLELNRRRTNLDRWLEQLATEEEPFRWPESDRRLSERLPDLQQADYDYTIDKIKSLPAERIQRTLIYLLDTYVNEDSEQGEAQFYEDYPKAVDIKPEIVQKRSQAKRGIFSSLQTKLRAILRARDWPEALERAQQQQEALAGYPPYEELVDILSRDEPDARLQLLGGGAVNTNIDEYTPVLTADGQQLYFCRFGALEEIYLAERQDSIWIDRGELPQLEHESVNVAPLSLTVDGNRMLIFKNGTLMYTDRTSNGWSDPRPYPDVINAGSWQGMGALSSDGRVLIFETRGRSDMAGGRYSGNTDLYISFLDSKDHWSVAQSLSKLINTPQVERAPYLHPDMKTLYFSTDARGGLGGLDVYKTTRLDNTWLNWSPPIHLGRNANTTGDDWGYKISTDGSFAYFSADPDGDQLQDIFQVSLPPEARPEPVTLLKTRLLQPDGSVVEGELRVEDLVTGELIAKLRTEPGTGWITAALPNDRQYALVFEGGQRLPFSDNLDLRAVTESQQLESEIVLNTVDELLAKEEGFTLRNIFFDHDQAILIGTSNAELQRVATILKAEANLQVILRGHTDNAGEEGYNLRLSQKRAEAVRAALIRRGITADRLRAEGLGEKQPISSNETEVGRRQNRRVELILEQ